MDKIGREDLMAKFGIEDEDLEKVAGGAGATKFIYNDFSAKLTRAVMALPSSEGNPNVGYVHKPIIAGGTAVSHDNYAEGKAQLILAVDRAKECGFSKTGTYVALALQYLADCGKIVLP